MAEGDGMDGASDGAASRTVFLSYASQDAEIANTVCQFLESHRIRCWIAPRDVAPGALYADAIVRAINESKCLLIVLSQSAVASSHVGRELERAASKRKPIIALRIDAAPLSPELEYFLSNSQWIDVAALGMPAALAKLADAAGRDSATSPTPNPPLGVTATQVAKASGVVSKRIAKAAAIIVVLVAAAILAIRFWPTKHSDPQTIPVAQISDKSIAVLPFADMSEKKDQEYFGDGMAEEIIDLLAKVPDLRVPARTSSFYFKGKTTKIPDIARELGVVHVLEGSIRRSGNQLRVTAQLVRADTGYHVWSETYDRDLNDVFKVQDDIANAVVQALQISLMGGPLTRQKGGTQNLEAYQLYLRAVKAFWQNDRVSTDAARADIERAVKLDPDFSLAWTMLGWVATDSFSPDGFERARHLANQALQLSPDLAAPHVLLGYIHRTYDWDWAAAQSEMRRALAIDQLQTDALETAGQVSATLGHWDDAERQMRAALERDPLNPDVLWNLATTLYRAGRFADAESEYRRLIEVAPDYRGAHGYLGKTLLAEVKREAALAMVQEEADEAARLEFLPIVLQAVGRRSEADEALQSLATKYASSDAYSVGMNYAYRNDHDAALQWLERAYKQKESGFVEIVGEPLFKNLKDDPRFKALLKKMNLPE
jgi:TolB-like protein/Flp pilus assembly protein TadD